MNSVTTQIKITLLALSSLALLSMGGCEQRDTSNQDALNTKGFYPRFDPSNGVIPFPNNLLFSGTTDLTLNIPVTDPADYSDPKVAMNALDGFSTVAPLTVAFSSAIDTTTMVGGDTVRIFDVTLNASGVVTAINSELLPNTDYVLKLSPADSSNSTLTIHPMRPFPPSSSYLVTLSRGFTDTLGNNANPELPYALAKGGTSIVTNQACLAVPGSCVSAYSGFTDAEAEQLEQLRLLTNANEAQIEGYTITADTGGLITDLAASDIVLSWSFTTQSIGNALSGLAAGAAPATVVTAPSGMTTQGVVPQLPGIADIHVGTIDLPYYLAAPSLAAPTAPLSEFWKNGSGTFLTPLDNTPVATYTQTAPLLMTVPNVGTMPTAGWPVVIFQHGITQDRTNLIAIADSLAAAGFAAVAIDLPLHGITDGTNPLKATNSTFPSDVERNFGIDFVDNTTGDAGPDGVEDESGKHFINLANLLVTRDNLRQAVADLFTLHTTLGSITSTTLDTNNVFFVGHSLGAMVGVPLLNLEPTIQDAVLAMPGGGIARFLDGSASFGSEIEAGLASAGVLKGTADYEAFLTAAQTVIDSGDPINYASSIGNSRGVLLFEVVGGNSSLPDQTIPNSLWPYAPAGTTPTPLAGTTPLAETMGLTKMSATNLTGADLKAWVRFNAGHHGSILTPNDADGNADALSASVTTEMQTQMASFLGSSGGLVLITDSTLIEAP
ncbi:MAG: Ig-like domain-containing protein [Chromatiales bacterium]|nr:Ig-like domain-containing protein [Chromatiales bacterium]